MDINTKKHKTIQFIAAALFIASACTDDRDNLMVNDQIGLLHSTYTETEIFRGMDTPINYLLSKVGKESRRQKFPFLLTRLFFRVIIRIMEHRSNYCLPIVIPFFSLLCVSTIPTIGKLLILNGMPTVYPIFFLRERNMACPYK